jgi:hypothetical protein
VALDGTPLARSLTTEGLPASTGEAVPPVSAARGVPRVALVTCGELPDLDPDDRLVIGPLAERGIRAEPAVWDDAAVDWAGYDLVVLRSAWDYPARRDAFLAWAQRVPRLANPAEVVAWSTDKRYLAALAEAGVPVPATTWLPPGVPWTLPDEGALVIKPAVGAGSVDSGRYDLGQDDHRWRAADHVARLHASGRTVMAQPYLPAVDTHGETALLYLDGRFSHAIRKGPMLDGPDSGNIGLYKPEEISPREPTPAELAVGDRAIAAVPAGSGPLLYARVDLIPDAYAEPAVIELELAEPSLFLGTAAGAPERFAAAIAKRLTP